MSDLTETKLNKSKSKYYLGQPKLVQTFKYQFKYNNYKSVEDRTKMQNLSEFLYLWHMLC